MAHTVSRLLTASALALTTGVFSIVACTHTSDRVVEPPGGADASTTTPEGADAAKPIGPIAPIEPIEHEPKEDFRLVRAPEFGVAREVSLISVSGKREQIGLGGAGNAAGFGGSDLRPVVVANGGSHYD